MRIAFWCIIIIVKAPKIFFPFCFALSLSSKVFFGSFFLSKQRERERGSFTVWWPSRCDLVARRPHRGNTMTRRWNPKRGSDRRASGGVGSYRELWMPFRNADGSSRPGDVCECAHKSRNARWKKKKRPASKWKVKKETTDDAVDAKSMCVLVYSFFRQSLLASKLATQTTVHTNSSICLAWYRFEFGRLR